MGERNCFLLFFDLSLPFVERSSSNKGAGQSCVSSQVGIFRLTVWLLLFRGLTGSAHLSLSFPAGRPESSELAQAGGEKRGTQSSLGSSSQGSPWGPLPCLGLPVDLSGRGHSWATHLSPPRLTLDYFKACVMSMELNMAQASSRIPAHLQLGPPPYVQVWTGRLPLRVRPRPAFPTYGTHTTFSVLQISNLRTF